MPEILEAEVLEIDGSPPPAPRESEPVREPAWKAVKGRVLRLDRRWWPLWVLLGLVAFALAAVLGLVFGVMMLAVKAVSGILRFLTGTASPRPGSGLSRTHR